MTDLKPVDFEMQRHIQMLDDTAIKYEAVWGNDRLPKLVPPELAAKWDSQMEKVNQAIINSDLYMMQDLSVGTVRAWEVLDKAARDAGHAPEIKDAWNVVHPDSGRRYRICKNLPDARGCAEEGVVVYTLEEVARILEGCQMVNAVKDTFPNANVSKVMEGFDFNKGDDVPEF